MKLKIEREFTDKYTGQVYKVGEEAIFKDERGKEILADPRGLVSEVKDEKPTKKPARKNKK